MNRVPGLAPGTLIYDTRGRLIEMNRDAGDETRTRTIHYYASGPQKGYVQSLADALGRPTLFDYDLAGRVIQQTLPDGRAIRFEYDANGNVIAIVPPGQPPHRFDYTALDQEQEYTPPDLGQGDPATRYGYNRDKDLMSVTRPDGQRVEIAYDSGGRLSTLTAPHGDTTYGYHAATGQLSTLTAPDGARLSYRYDGFLMTEISWAGNITGRLNRKYNSDLRITELAVNGSPIPFGYDADGLVIQAGALALTRNPDHGLLTGTALGALTDRYTYNGFGEVTDYGAEFNAAPLLTTAYTRDGLGRIVEKRETEGGITRTHAYAYDLAGRLVEVNENSAVIATYRYDENGNRTHLNDVEVAHYDAQDRLLDYQGTTYAYTPNGDLTSKTEGVFTTVYDYDVLGNLRSVELPNGSRIDYLIDGQNRRIGKKVDGVLAQGFLYQDQLKPIAELNGNNQVVSRFVYADKSNVPAYLVKNGITYRILSDHLGSPRLTINTADGTIVQRMDYDEWGRVILDTKPGFQPFGFAGGLYDRDTRLVRFGARDYDAETGRWTAKDPIRFKGGDTNLYGYVLNDPINLTDPFGLAPGELNGATHATLGGAVHGAAQAIRSQSSQGVEWFCWICRDQNGYHYTDPRTDNDPINVESGPRPNNCPVVGDIHNHPNIPGYNHNNPSTLDKGSNYVNQIPGFLLTPSDIIRRYDPAPSGAEPSPKNPTGGATYNYDRL